VYLAEDFGLAHNITISVTDVYLSISWIESWIDPPLTIPEPWIFAALLVFVSTAAICLGGYFIYYYRVLKYPRPVRKVRKFRRTLNRSSAPNVLIMPRKKAFKNSFKKELGDASKMVKLKPSPSKVAKGTEKGEFAEELEKSIEKKINSDQLIKESLEKKSELDKIVDKSLDKN